MPLPQNMYINSRAKLSCFFEDTDGDLLIDFLQLREIGSTKQHWLKVNLEEAAITLKAT